MCLANSFYSINAISLPTFDQLGNYEIILWM
jgi:hypothetical protein